MGTSALLLSPELFETNTVCRVHGNIPWHKRIWAAVVRRAVVDWVLYKNHENIKLKKLGLDADVWIFRGEDVIPVNSFQSVCDFLNIEPDVIRSKIRALTEEEARRLRGMEFGDEW